MSVGIRAVGAYAPRFRVTAEAFEEAWGSFDAPGVETKAVPDADEDALTMGYEAATRALDAAEVAPEEVDFLAFASTTPPLAEEDLTVRLGSLLGVESDATRHVFTGSTRAGTRALAAALDAGPERGLVVVADCPRGEPHDAREHAAGAGAAAFVVGPEAPLRVTERVEHADAYPGTRFRRTGEERVGSIDAGVYDRNAFVRPLAAAVEDIEVGDLDAAAIQMPDGKLPYRAAGAMGLDNGTVHAGGTVSTLGDTGAASVPLGLASALSEGAERLLAVSWGSGAGADAFLLAAEGEVPVSLALDGDEEVSYAEYLRLRGEITAEEPDGGGAYVSVPTWHRSLPQRHRLVAGRCPECGTYTFPPEGACRGCDTLVEFEEVALSGDGTVEAQTEIGKGGAPPEFAELQSRSGAFGVAIVAFDAPDGGEATAPAMVVGDAAVGDRVEATQRRIYTQEGVTRYGFKVRRAE
ncbi:zinc ribbon domain-containing protein [Halosegnis marinus]|uniref:Zinc ribbon domain-containing protein n=1 Tax=Halosegnis marinus TaxID=3034023 RepID=A0ABD5ZSR0_9EURY|nr:zinc ribbon domain-containing protein [Halosegnis sp. DT85]